MRSLSRCTARDRAGPTWTLSSCRPCAWLVPYGCSRGSVGAKRRGLFRPLASGLSGDADRQAMSADEEDELASRIRPVCARGRAFFRGSLFCWPDCTARIVFSGMATKRRLRGWRCAVLSFLAGPASLAVVETKEQGRPASMQEALRTASRVAPGTPSRAARPDSRGVHGAVVRAHHRPCHARARGRD